MAAADIPFKQEGAGFWADSLSALFTSMALLAVMVLALYLLRHLLRKKMPQAFQAAPAAALRVRERMRINPRLQLYVVQYGARELLLGHSGDTLVKLAESDGAAQAAPPASPALSPPSSPEVRP